MIVKHLDVFLPIALVIIVFILKLFMDRSVRAPMAVKSLYELPVDILMLTLSFAVAFTITSPSNTNSGLAHLFVFFIIILLSVVGWRRSIDLFEREKKGKSVGLFLVNFAVAGYCLTIAVKLIIGV
jgi:hypothetical protein